MDLKIKHYILLLFREGTIWENRPLNERNEKEKIFAPLFSVKRILFLALAIVFSFFLKKGFNDQFIGYTMSVLTIFIGLFISVIISLYQKFVADEINHENLIKNGELKPNDNLNANRNKIKKFIKQFTFVTGKNFLIATILITTTTFMLLFKEFFSIDISTFKIVGNIQEVKLEQVLNFVQYSIVIGGRILSLYLFFDFFFLLLYSLGALFAFLKGEYGTD